VYIARITCHAAISHTEQKKTSPPLLYYTVTTMTASDSFQAITIVRSSSLFDTRLTEAQQSAAATVHRLTQARHRRDASRLHQTVNLRSVSLFVVVGGRKTNGRTQSTSGRPSDPRVRCLATQCLATDQTSDRRQQTWVIVFLLWPLKSFYPMKAIIINILECRGNYSTPSNNMKLVHWPLMGGLLHLVQRGGDWAGPQPTKAPPRCTTCNSPSINAQCTNHHICIMVRCSAVLVCPFSYLFVLVCPLKG